MPAPVVLMGVLVALLLVGCGVSTEHSPHAVQSVSMAQPPAPSTAEGAAIYFVRDGRLFEVHRRVTGDERSRLVALLSGVNDSDAVAGLRTAIPATMRLRSVRRSGDLVTVDLAGDLGEASAQEQTLAIAQVVFTSTATGASAVRLLVDGVLVQVPRADGVLDSSELHRSDFAEEAPLHPTGPATGSPSPRSS